MKKVLIGLLLVFVVSACCTSCDDNRSSSSQNLSQNTFGKEMQRTEQNQSKLLKNQPPPTLDWSLERKQLKKRTDLWNNANKTSYIYLIDRGIIMAYYVIKGKVSSVNSAMTNPEQIVITDQYDTPGQYNGKTAHVVSSPQEDGSYGSNGDAIFFFTVNDVYVEWNGKYMLCDQPLKLSQKPLMVAQVDKTGRVVVPEIQKSVIE